MDVDRKKSNGVCLCKLTPDERKKMIEEGQCFTCREKGHLLSQCPKKEQGRTGRAMTKGNLRTVKEDDEMSSQSSSPSPPSSHPKTCKATKPSTSTHQTTTEDKEEEQEMPPGYTCIACIRMKALKKSLKPLSPSIHSQVCSECDDEEDF